MSASDIRRLVRMEAEANRLADEAQATGRHNDAVLERMSAQDYGRRIHNAMVANRKAGAR